MACLQYYLSIAVFVALCGEWRTLAYRTFQDRIPNGKNVPNPCKPGEIWQGVGHHNMMGRGVRNPFGLDFKERELTWDECLCRRDSDGDGKTNGEELGDPDCQFMNTGQVASGGTISHPGICEPITDPKCMEKNQWLECEREEFSCPQFEEPGVQSITLKLDDTAVPPQETTYICQHFDFPDDMDYHLIGSIPELVNQNAMHHIVAYGCPDTEEARNATSRFSSPNADCGMVPTVCNVVVGLWGFGFGGQCFEGDFGFKIGRNGLRGVVLELHWNNPQEVSTWRDSSGLTFFYTPTLRQNDAGSTFIGPSFLAIPPQQSSVIYEGGCPGVCTERMIGEANVIYIPIIIPHMHNLGRRFNVTIVRAATNKAELVIQENYYSYDNPQAETFDPPLEIYPGDEIKVTCEFSSETRDDYTVDGAATSDEMCFALTTYYPLLPTMSDCTTTGGIAFCGNPTLFLNEDEWNKCWNTTRIFWAGVRDTISRNMNAANCDVNGLTCTRSCTTYLNQLDTAFPGCFNDITRDLYLQVVRGELERDGGDFTYLKQLLSCDGWKGLIPTGNGLDDLICGPTQAATSLTSSMIGVLVVGMQLLVQMYTINFI